jgi:hypothetical protein
MDLTQNTAQTRDCHVAYRAPADIEAGTNLLLNAAVNLAG